MRFYRVFLHDFLRLCRIMNPFVILMLSFAFGASAATYSQDQLVSLKLHHSDVWQLFQEVKEQTGLRFVFNEDYAKDFPAVNVTAKNEKVQDVLNKVFASSNLECRFEDDVVFIVKREMAAVAQQELSLKGKVTDLNGEWVLNIPETEDITLVFSFVGMKSQEIKYTGQQEINVVLQEDITEMDEVIVTGYQTILKERATGSFSTVNAERLDTKLQPNLNSVLEGMMTGVVVDRKGNIEIRGISTFNAEIFV